MSEEEVNEGLAGREPEAAEAVDAEARPPVSAADSEAALEAESAMEVCSREGHVAAAEHALLRADEVVAGYIPGVSILNGTDLYAEEGELVGSSARTGRGSRRC